MSPMPSAPEVLWRPSAARVEGAALTAFTRAAERVAQRQFPDYSALHAWSVQERARFWELLLEFVDVIAEGPRNAGGVPGSRPGACFFEGLRLNFAENLLRASATAPTRVALVSVSESRETRRTTYAALARSVAAVARRLRALGVRAGDRVAGYVPNAEEAVVAMLASASLGAVWSSCSPDFGVQGVLDRFGQITPRVLIAANAYRYGGKTFDCLERVRDIAAAIPSIEQVVIIEHLAEHPTALEGLRARVWTWSAFASCPGDPLPWTRFPFNQPLYVLYSSGTTGVPKCIVHGAGGTLVQHAKELVLHADLRPDDAIAYFTTCGWMMWNWLVSSLFVGATVVLFDGSPSHPDLGRFWRLAADEGLTHLGTSPKFLGACRDHISPHALVDLSRLRVLLSTGSPLLPEDFDWVYREVKSDVQLASISGGTDLISCFMLGVPTLPVVRGEIQAFGLGMDVAVFDEHDEPVIGHMGELVCRAPFPSMPVSFWNDPQAEAYRRAYFKGAPGVWYHGDSVALTGSQGRAGGVVVFGRSDATLNPGGVRIGTAEIYRLVETLPEIDDSIVVTRPVAGDVAIVLFVKLAPDVTWSAALAEKLRATIRGGATARHVPSEIHPVAAIPYTVSGKKVELAVRQILCGEEPRNRSALQNPESLELYRRFVTGV